MRQNQITITKKGLMGHAIALGISWAMGNNILWCLWHAMCGWIYIAYWAIEHTILKELLVK